MVVIASFSSVMLTIGYVLLALLALTFMVAVHELGHYLAGKALGFKINEFAIGFGPAIFKKKNKKNGEVFSIRPIPLGGFCQFEDEDGTEGAKRTPEETLEARKNPKAFTDHAPWKRIIVLAAGAIFNLIAAIIIITFIFTFSGQRMSAVYKMYPDSPNIGVLQEGDIFLRVDGRLANVLMPEDLNSYLKDKDSVEVSVLRDGKKVKLTLIKGDCTTGYFKDGEFVAEAMENGDTTYYGFGFVNTLAVQKVGFFSAIGRACSYMFFIVFKMLAILGQLVTGMIGLESVGGPITVISQMSEAASYGFTTFAFFICLISANLAVMNLLPLPALDGSRIVFCIIEWIFKRPVKRSIEATVHAIGFFLLLGFSFFVEIYRFFKVGF